MQIRQKNSSRVAKLIQGFLSGQVDSAPDFLQIEGSLYPLELLIELGLEKLTCDYYYIFLDSQSVGRDELQAPQLVRYVSLYKLKVKLQVAISFSNAENMPAFMFSCFLLNYNFYLCRAGLGVTRDRWLASCGQLLGWLAQVHTALEMSLPLQNSLPSNTFTVMASKALKYYQSEMSPVRSVAGLLSPGSFLQEFSFGVNTEAVRDLLTE